MSYQWHFKVSKINKENFIPNNACFKIVFFLVYYGYIMIKEDSHNQINKYSHDNDTWIMTH